MAEGPRTLQKELKTRQGLIFPSFPTFMKFRVIGFRVFKARFCVPFREERSLLLIHLFTGAASQHYSTKARSNGECLLYASNKPTEYQAEGTHISFSFFNSLLVYTSLGTYDEPPGNPSGFKGWQVNLSTEYIKNKK